jgi:hypothetical protein
MHDGSSVLEQPPGFCRTIRGLAEARFGYPFGQNSREFRHRNYSPPHGAVKDCTQYLPCRNKAISQLSLWENTISWVPRGYPPVVDRRPRSSAPTVRAVLAQWLPPMAYIGPGRVRLAGRQDGHKLHPFCNSGRRNGAIPPSRLFS